MKHMEGPWEIQPLDGLDDQDIAILDTQGFPVAIAECWPILHNWSKHFPDLEHWSDGSRDGRTTKERTREEVLANARLMASAPDLLKALEVARSCLVGALRAHTAWYFQTDEDCKEHFAVKQIDAAIAKATESK